MKQLEKEINITSQRNMMKRYQMYGATVSKLTEKSQNDTKKGEKSLKQRSRGYPRTIGHKK